MMTTLRLARRPRTWGLLGAILLLGAGPASAQFGYGAYGGSPYGGYGGYGYGGYGLGGYGGYGLGGYGGYGLGGFVGSGVFYPPYNTATGNPIAAGIAPPAYGGIGFGYPGVGYPGIGGINPLFGLGISPLGVHNAVAEQNLRLRYSPYSGGYYRAYGGNAPRPGSFGNATLPNSYTNTTIPNGVSTVPR